MPYSKIFHLAYGSQYYNGWIFGKLKTIHRLLEDKFPPTFKEKKQA